jgi:hypothetical protein
LFGGYYKSSDGCGFFFGSNHIGDPNQNSSTTGSLFDLGQYWSDVTGWFNTIGSAVSGIGNSLNPSSQDFFLKKAFLPSDGYLQGKFQEFQTKIAQKLDYKDYNDFFTQMQNMQVNRGEYTATVHLYGVGDVTGKFIDTSYYDSNKTWIYMVIRGVLAVMLVIFNINQIYKFLNRGASLASSGEAMSWLERGGKD